MYEAVLQEEADISPNFHYVMTENLLMKSVLFHDFSLGL